MIPAPDRSESDREAIYRPYVVAKLGNEVVILPRPLGRDKEAGFTLTEAFRNAKEMAGWDA